MLAIVTQNGTSLIDPACFKNLPTSFPISSSLGCSMNAWSQDNSQLYLANSSSIKRYTPSECLLEELHYGLDVVTCLAVKSKSNMLFFVAANKVWSLDGTHLPGKVLFSLESHKSTVTKISMSNDGTLLVSVSASAVFVHNMAFSSYTRLKGLPDGKPVTCCLFHQHSRTKLLLGIGRDLLVYDSTRPGGPLKTVRIPGGGDIVGVASSPFSKTLVAIATSNGDVVLIDLDKEHGVLKTVNVNTSLTCCAFTAEGAAIYLGTESGKLLVLDLRSLERVPKSFSIGDGSTPIKAINVQCKPKSPLGDTASAKVRSGSSAVVKSSPRRPASSMRTASTGSAFAGSGAKSPMRAMVSSKIRGGGGVTPKKKPFSLARTPLTETKNFGIDAQLAASQSPTPSCRVQPLRLQRSREQEDNGEVYARPPSSISCGVAESATARQFTRSTSSRMEKGVEHLGLGSAPESISGHLAAMLVRSGSVDDGPTGQGDRAKKPSRRIISESVEIGRRPQPTSTGSTCSKVSSSKSRVVRAQQQAPRSTTPDNDDDRLDLSSPDLPCEPVTPISLGKHTMKTPAASATCSGNDVLGLSSIEAKGDSNKGKGKENVVGLKKARFAQHPDTGESSGGSDLSADVEGAGILMDRNEERDRELSLQVSPRRPTAPPAWLQSPHRPAAANMTMNTAAQDFLRSIVHDVMYDFQRETKAEMMGLHLDLVRMGRGWKRELRDIMKELNGEIQELRAENRRLKEENERLRKGY